MVTLIAPTTQVRYNWCVNLKEIVWHIPDIECEGCVRSIHHALDDIEGVQQVEVDLLRKTVRVVFDATTVEAAQLQRALEAAGFTPSH